MKIAWRTCLLVTCLLLGLPQAAAQDTEPVRPAKVGGADEDRPTEDDSPEDEGDDRPVEQPADPQPDPEPQGDEEPPEEDDLLDEEDPLDEDDPIDMDGIDIFHSPEDLSRLGGAANLVDEEQLEKFEYDDPHSVLLQVPGLYVRQEDAFGLRPNIGLRGANSDRSKKVTLMEDGVLFAPAPYAAPAAYYFPMMTRMTGVEVFKGPGAVIYGPNTIGGAVNLKTRDIPTDAEGRIDVAAGSYLTGKVHAYYGASNDWGGFLIEGVHLQSDGFKELDGGGDTGFNKQELMLKLGVNSDLDADTFHRVELKLGIARELSHETYLGLSDADFEASPNRRYAASARDEMDWLRTQATLTHKFELGSDFEITSVAYRHDFGRLWSRLNGFQDGPSLSEILADPTSGQRAVFYDVLTGQQDTSADAETLLIVNNERTFFSQGVQSVASWRLEGEPGQDGAPAWLNTLEVGVRLHNDQIERDHATDSFTMTGGELVSDGAPSQPVVRNNASALALAAYAFDTFTIGALSLAPGLRVEVIQTDFEDQLAGTSQDNSQQVLIPGFGAFYAFTPTFGALAGVHRGFSPVAPGQPDGVEPETSVNYEAGARYLDIESGSQAELIGFFNDYNNLSGQCSFSAGCDPDQLDNQFNAGEVNVYGAEALLAHRFPLTSGLAVPARLAYTYTRSEFKTSFVSENPQFGEVEEGDELPYVPEHQASLSLGLDGGPWGLTLGATFVDEMREVAGQGEPEEGAVTDRYLMLDAAARYAPLDWLELYARADNLTNTRPIVSRRPFGARPARPFLAQGGLKLSF